MSKYGPLTDFLKKQGRHEVSMSFRDIEAIIGAPLPPSKLHRAWWSNNPSNNVMTKAWLAAGYETEQVDVAAERLKFVQHSKLAGSSSGDIPLGTAHTGATRRHPAFGALKGTTIVMPGVDLTEPTAPEWGKLTDD